MINVFSQLHFLAAAVYLGVGVYTLLQDRSSGTNRFFMLLSLCFAVWAYANGLAISASTETIAWRLFSIFAPLWFLFPPLLLHFSLRLIYHRIPRPRLLLSVLYLPGLLIYLLTGGGTEIISGFPGSGAGRHIIYDSDNPFYFINIAYYTLYVLLTIALFIRWYRVSRSRHQRRQALTILLSLAGGAVLASSFGTLLPLLGLYPLPPVTPLCMLIWVLGMSIAVVKWRLMRLTPDFAAATILRHIRDYVVLCNERDEIVHVNTKLAEQLRTSSRALEGRAAGGLFPFAAEIPLTEFLGGEEVRERTARISDSRGREIPVQLTVMRMRDETSAEVGFVLVGHDLSTLLQLELEKDQHRKTSEQLKLSEETFSTAFQASPVGMAIINTSNDVIEQMNDSARRILAFEHEESCELPDSGRLSFLSWVSTEEETVFRQTMDRHGSVQGMKSELYRCDGLPVEVLISADRINIGNEEKQLFCFSDLTRTNQLERELITMQKFESIGLLAGGIAHDFNNLLTAIMGNISLAKEEIPPTEDSIIESLDLALAACNHASQLTGQLLTFSKSDVTHSAVISVIEAVEQSVRLALSGTEIETVIDDSDNRLKVRADRGELVQVFNNLLINAKQAMPDGGRVSITIRRYVHPEGGRYSTNAPMSLKNGEYVRVSVSDNGPGIPRNRLPHLFDPYFTTKPSGSGLGLSIVYSLLKKYGGEVTVQSRKGAGSTFNVFFPAIAEAAEERSAAGQTASDFSGIVLLMDDEESIRRVGAQLLAQLGCTVFTDSNGEALLERVAELRKQGIEPDAVILDLTVAAGLNGLQTAEALRSVIPRVPIILTTGHTEHEILEDYSSYGFDDYLVKPFAREHLAEVLARHLPYGACIDEETV